MNNIWRDLFEDFSLYEFNLDKDNNVRNVCRTQKGSRNKEPKPTKKFKHDIEGTHNV